MLGMFIVGISLLCVSSASIQLILRPSVLQFIHLSLHTFTPASIHPSTFYLSICSSVHPCVHVGPNWMSNYFVCVCQVPFATSIYGLIGPNGGLGFAIGDYHSV